VQRTLILVKPDGALGARNDVRCASVEHKLGIHASPTCVMVYGDAGGATALEVFYALLRHTRQLVAAAEVPPAMPAAEVAKTIGVHPFTAKKLLEQRANFDRRSLGRALITLADAEAGMKGKAQVEPELVLEMALAQLIGGR